MVQNKLRKIIGFIMAMFMFFGGINIFGLEETNVYANEDYFYVNLTEKREYKVKLLKHTRVGEPGYSFDIGQVHNALSYHKVNANGEDTGEIFICIEAGTDFHTYDSKREKASKYVLKGEYTESEEVVAWISWLKDQGLHSSAILRQVGTWIILDQVSTTNTYVNQVINDFKKEYETNPNDIKFKKAKAYLYIDERYAGQRLIDFEYVKYEEPTEEEVEEPKEPNIKTTFIGENNEKELDAKDNTRLIDIIEYKDLPLGEVKIVSEIVRKNSNETLTKNERTVDIKDSEGYTSIEFEVDLSKLENEEIVAFQSIYKDGELIVSHKDINDKNQTIYIKKELIKGKAKGYKINSINNKKIEGVEIGLFKIEDGKETKALDINNKEIKSALTDKNGYFEFNNIQEGKYIIKELKNTKGFVNDLAKTEIFTIDKKNNNKTYEFNLENTPVMGQIILNKTGDVLSNVEDTNKENISKLTYKNTLLNNTKWELKAREDIYDLGDNSLVYKKGDLIETLTTNSKNPVKSKLLPLGKYELKEISTPNQYKLDDNIYEIDLSIEDETKDIVTKEVNSNNIRKKYSIEFNKVFEDTNLFNLDPEAEFGLFLAEDYKENNKVIKKDTLISKKKVKLKDIKESNKAKVIFDDIRFNGKFYIKELNVSDGYKILNKNINIQVDPIKFNKEKNIISLDDVNNNLEKITLEIIKKEEGSVQNPVYLSDVEFKLVAINGKEENIVGKYKTNKEGKIIIEALPKGTYYLQETKEKDGYFKNDKKIEIDLTKEKENKKIIEVNNEKIPSIKTKASNTVTGEKIIMPLTKVSIKDTVSYKDLIVGKKYNIEASLMDKETGKVLVDSDKKEIVKNIEFIADKRDGELDVVFEIDSSHLAGKEIVFFERLYKDDKLLTVHEDINDKDQTIKINNPNIKTKLIESNTGNKTLDPIGVIELKDIVEYYDLIPGEEYELKLTLMDKSSNEKLTNNDKIYEKVIKFTPSTSNGNIEVNIEIDTKEFIGKEIVAYQELFYNNELIVDHRDINNLEQTIKINNPSIKTTANFENGLKENYRATDNKIIDKVTYENLVVGNEYTIKGKLMSKKTNSPILIDGKEVTSEITFIADKESGFVELEFIFDGNKIDDYEIVVFENLYSNDTLIYSHEDINDIDQTVSFLENEDEDSPIIRKNKPINKDNPNTGDSGVSISIFLVSICTIAFILNKKILEFE